MIKKTGSLIIAIVLGVVAFLPNVSVGAADSCTGEKADGTVWYRGGSVTRAGTLEPGQSYNGVIEACNRDIVTRHVKLSTEPYSINQSDYDTVDFLTKNNWNRLSDWITFPEGDVYSIESGELAYLKFHIQVPSDGSAIAGTQTASIMLTDTFREDNEENVGVQTEKRYLWLVTANINGANMRAEGKIISWKASGFLVFDNTKGLNTRSIVENTGNVSFVADYKVKISDLFRNSAVAYESESQKEIFPESKRANEFKWEEAPVFGIFNIKEEITVFDKTETFEKVVLILPLWFVVIVVAMIILLLWALILKIKQHHEKNKRLNS